MISKEEAEVFPAPAGMNRSSERCWLALSGVPRASGDEPPPNHEECPHVQCSPRQRG